MNHGYILNLAEWRKSMSSREYDMSYAHGLALKNNAKKDTRMTIHECVDPDGRLSAEYIMEELFSEVSADVFLSHSHKDMKTVTAFAGYLDYIGAKPFVDSFVWGDAYKLLWNVNDIYSRDDSGDFGYDDVSYNAAQIYMILNGALIDMMDRTENFVLLGTEASIQNGTTTSPWIYSELLYSKILCPRQLIFEHTDMSFPAFTDHLYQLKVHEIELKLGRHKPIYG